ncbi:MAG TPA: VWA domain-containing protein [Actinomycetota bacterium]
MTFEWPHLLWLVLLAPAALALQLWSERRRRRQAAAFANPALLPNMVTARPGWRSWLPVACYLLAATVLLVALARPEAVARVPRDEATVMLVVDASASMLAQDVTPSRVQAARRAVGELLDRLPERFQVGLVSFAATARAESAPTRDRAAVRRALAGFQVRPGTAMGDGLRLALELSRGAATGRAGRPPTTVLLLGDGINTNGSPPLAAAEAAAREHVQVFTVALGTPQGALQQADGSSVPVPPDEATLRRVAEATGGRFFTAPGSDELAAVYRDVGSRITYAREEREVTAAFLAGAVALLLAGAWVSLLLFRRLP